MRLPSVLGASVARPVRVERARPPMSCQLLSNGAVEHSTCDASVTTQFVSGGGRYVFGPHERTAQERDTPDYEGMRAWSGATRLQEHIRHVVGIRAVASALRLTLSFSSFNWRKSPQTTLSSQFCAAHLVIPKGARLLMRLTWGRRRTKRTVPELEVARFRRRAAVVGGCPVEKPHTGGTRL